MFERYLTDALTSHLGHLVQGWDADKIRVSAWNGELVLRDILLRKDALDHLVGGQAPFEVAYGRVGNLEVRVPWKLIRAQLLWGSSSASASQQQQLQLQQLACSVVLTDVNILITPRRRKRSPSTSTETPTTQENGSDPDKPPVKPNGQQLKQQDMIIQNQQEQSALDAEDAELLKKVQQSSKGSNRWQWIIDRLVGIFSNLSVTVRNVHIRYEDPGTSMGFIWTSDAAAHHQVQRYRNAFSIGITLREFSVQTTDEPTDDETNTSKGIVGEDKQATSTTTANGSTANGNVQQNSSLETKAASPSSDRIRRSLHGRTPSTDTTVSDSPALVPFQIRHKLVATQQLAAYWDSDCRIMAAVLGEDDEGGGEQAQYFEQAFVVLNNGAGAPDFAHSSAFRSRRTFLLDPFSPSIRFALVAKNSVSNDNHNQSTPVPPSTMDVSLPPCRFTISRDLLEDLGYLRKSFAVWTQARKGVVSEAALRRLTKLRPVRSPLEDPRSWWKYAFEAVRLLRELDADSRDTIQRAQGKVASIDTSLRDVDETLDKQSSMESQEDATNNGRAVGEASSGASGMDEGSGKVTWMTSLMCPEFSLQVNDRPPHFGRRPVPVVRLSCAFLQEQLIYQDGSWELTNRIGSLVVKDCTSMGDPQLGGQSVFPYLIAPRGRGDLENDEKLYLNGVPYRQSVWVRLRRSPHGHEAGREGSTTTTEVHALPMDFVYATAPVEALSRVLITANLELADDYHRMASRLHEWREDQKKRLIQALAHKQKTIIVDVDVGAPVLLIPEESRRDSPLLIIDFGRLKFHNGDKKEIAEGVASGEFDQWRLEICDVQVQCSSTHAYRDFLSRGPANESLSAKKLSGTDVQQVVEPFSLNFEVSTQIQSEEDQSVEILATLPRLVFNMSSSAVRLILRLQTKWNERKGELQAFALRSSRLIGGMEIYQSTSKLRVSPPPRRMMTKSINRRIQFRFVAPLLNFKFENDVDGRDCRPKGETTAAGTTLLIDLALRGIEGKVLAESSSTGNYHLTYSAKLRSVDAVDLYQRAGEEYALLLSSISPNLVLGLAGGNAERVDKNLSSTDLVTFEYRSVKESLALDGADRDVGGFLDSPLRQNHHSSDTLSVQFHELYVEWNPETLAALHKAMMLPKEYIYEEGGVDVSYDETVFYDAEEDNFYDADSMASEEDAILSLSEISSSRKSSFSGTSMEWEPQLLRPTGLRSPMGLMSPMTLGPLESRTRLGPLESPMRLESKRPFDLFFNLSKLRVNFNKESRHRALISVEMDRTSIHYATRHGGGSKTVATIGNLTFSDSDSAHNKTLYREILGLQTDNAFSSDGTSSLLEMEMVTNPRSRHCVSRADERRGTDDVEKSVSVDVAQGTIQGCDSSLRIRFSPMRFVYFQQLWFEIVDYFFEGVIGSAVWGIESTASASVPDTPGVAPQAEKISFTRFDVLMDSPVILFPVTYCSTDFIRLEASSIAFANRYDCRPMRRPQPTDIEIGNIAELQWYNNCEIRMTNLRLGSWSGSRLTQGEDSVTAIINMDWPTGPTAPLNVPKWNVDCSFDALYLYLLKEDYALLQSVVQHNLGEPSRHLDEWHALQSLPPLELEHYKESIMVNFGYDKKDVTPTTFQMTVRLPLLCFSLRKDERCELAVVRCVDIKWDYKKLLDRVSQQKVTCDVEIVGPLNGRQVEMLSSRRQHRPGNAEARVIPGLSYTSTTQPSGDNTKMLEIVDACIHVVYPVWRHFAKFFQGLPEPTYLDPEEVIQVGDRWYKMGVSPSKTSHSVSPRRLTWITGSETPNTTGNTPDITEYTPAYRFRLSLKRPSIVLASESSSLVLLMDGVDFHHRGQAGSVSRTVSLENITLQTTGPGHAKRSDDLSLVRPFSVAASSDQCNGQSLCKCDSHSVRITAEVFKARVAYSDMSRAIDVCLLLIRDMKAVTIPNGQVAPVASPRHTEESHAVHETPAPSSPKQSTFHFNWAGVEMTVVDDSGRHFAASQELVILSLGAIDFTRKEERVHPIPTETLAGTGQEIGRMKYSMTLRFTSVTLIDSLQSQTSPFRLVVAIQGVPEPALSTASAGFDDRKHLSSHECPFAVELQSLVNESRTYAVKIRSFALQYNPSMIIALQRFLGRLMKDARTKAHKVFNESLETFIRSTGDRRESETSALALDPMVLIASVEFQSVSICLNKEHQGRRLLIAILSDCRVNLKRTQLGSVVDGHVGDLSVTDPDTLEGRADVNNWSLLQVSCGSELFVKFRYQTFVERKISTETADLAIPAWVRSEVAGNNSDIDDCLDISIGGIEVTLLRERTEELMDYLSNGMPGKGMGATSQAAKGFLKSRIRTKSFLQVHVDAPKMMIPQHEGIASGICFSLGDLNVKSWIIEDAESTESTRMLAVNLLGFSGGVYGRERRESEGLSNVDMTIEVAKTKSLLAVTCHLSDVHIHLSYTDYVSAFLVMRENLGRASEKKSWDNLEVAWEAEAASVDKTQKVDSSGYSKEVSYSTNARHVRYGRKKQPSVKVKTSYDFKFRFDILSVILRRNDPLDNDAPQNDYDMVLMRGQGFEASLNSSGDGDQSAGFSLHRIFLYDLGEKGRVLRRSRDARKGQLPSVFSIMVDGYSPPDKEGETAGGGNADAQVIISVDRHTSSPGDANVNVLINYLSIAALVRPFEELADFLLRKWPVSIRARKLREKTESMDANAGDSLEGKSDTVSASSRSFHVKFVLHYPRLILVADESDPHSRGLVVRGLAIVNASFAKRLSVDIDSQPETDAGKNETVTRINSDFQNISTYINPDVGDALGLWYRHSAILAEVPGLDHTSLAYREQGEDGADDFGVALLLPLTVNFEFEQVRCVGSKTKRSLVANMDPLSVIVSFQDIQLVELVTKKWTSKGAPRHTPRPIYFYDVTFHGERLGLGLRKEGGQIVVDCVGQSVLLEQKGFEIQMSDALHSLNGKVIVNPGGLPLSTMVERLMSEPRPLTIRFARNSQYSDSNGQDGRSGSLTSRELTGDDDVYQGSVDSVDVSLSAAVFTLVENEIPLFRGKVSTTTVTGELLRTRETKLHFNSGSTIEVEYYNLRIWGWEPLIEPGGITLSAAFLDPPDGPRELALEVGDRIGNPLCLNITDGAVEALSKLKEWNKASVDGEQLDSPLFPEDAYATTTTNGTSDDGESFYLSRQELTEANRFVSRKAANAALSFAQRQKCDTAKPFVFQNRTGVSIALVRQKQGDVKGPVNLAHSFVAVGDYNGLQGYNDAEITVVGNGEEGKFRMDVLTDEVTDGESRTQCSHGRFPFLTVAFQAVAGVTIEPLTDLPIFRASRTLLPLRFSRGDADAVNEEHCARHSVVWLVEQTDEKTILTLGSSVRFDCLSLTPVEVGAQEEGGFNGTLGIARRGKPLYFPLWLAMQQTVCHCSLRPVGQYHFAPLFRLLPEGSVETEETIEGCIECRAANKEESSVWLAVMQRQDHEALETTIDCCLSIRNLLPLSLDWEVAMNSPTDDAIIDGSTTRSWNLGLAEDSILNSGEYAEVFSRGSLLKARFRQRGGREWSTWASLSFPIGPPTSREEGVDDSDQVLIRHVSVNDVFGIPLTFGVRIIRKICGLEVAVYSELWFKNCTSLPLAFGCVRDQLLGPKDERKTEAGSDVMSATAEAALKEISSLFETGEEGTGLRRQGGSRADANEDIFLLPGQVVSCITEECFEYMEAEASTVKRRWWASEDPQSIRNNLTLVEDDGGDWHWLDKSWRVDTTGKTSDGWESSASLVDFSGRREFSPSHRFRRRRLLRRRTGGKPGLLVNGIEAFHQPLLAPKTTRHQEGKPQRKEMRIAIQADGGKWALTSKTPVEGTVYGAMRTAGPKIVGRTGIVEEGSVYELCYYISPLDGDWGAFSRLMLVTSRFLLRNDSTRFVFEVKQTGAPDSTAQRIGAGCTAPFHWADFRLPELVSARPAVEMEGRPVYRWSGGFDPLTIGAVPLRIRKTVGFSLSSEGSLSPAMRVCSMKMEAEIRPKTGKVGINLSFREEDEFGDGALFRIENVSTFPIWVAQDGILANPSRDLKDSGETEGDILLPSDRMAFALDVPFRQGKYAGRKAATMTELFRLRFSLAPSSSRTGVETTKVVAFRAGERIRLNPSKLAILEPKARQSLQRVRVIGVVYNDGPTRVLRFCLIKKTQVGPTFPNPFGAESMGPLKSIGAVQTREIIAAAATTVDLLANSPLPTEEEVVNKALGDDYPAADSKELEPPTRESLERIQGGKDTIVSVRVSFSGFVVSLVDAAPSEIAVLALRNVNALATWNTKRTTDATVYVTITDVQVDNMVPNAPFPVAVARDEEFRENAGDDTATLDAGGSAAGAPPLLVVGLSFAPKHKSGIVCLKSVTVAPRNLAIKVDLAFLVRIQKYALDLMGHFSENQGPLDDRWTLPDINKKVNDLTKAGDFGVGSQTFYFGGLTILPCNIKLSVAPARGLTPAQATLEGDELAAIHQAVRKGDVGLGKSSALFGVKIGSRNATPLAVVRGVFKSFVVDAILCLDGASLNFAGLSLRNHISSGPKLSTHLGAHYLESLRQNVPALLGSLAVFGNPLGLVRGLGDGVSDFVLEPVKGFQKSVQEMDASYLVDGVARGTVSLARHTVGGFADSTAMLAETFSKNMTVLTLDRRYAQKRDRGEMLRNHHGDVNVAVGFESGVQKLVQGFLEGVTGVVKAPIRGAEKRGFEGFAKGIGKGLLGLLVKPIIGISDGITDVMIGVKGSIDGGAGLQGLQLTHVRPRRPLYGSERAIRPYSLADAAAAALMLRTRLAGENYLSHVDMGDRVALLSVKRLVLLGPNGEEVLVLKYKHIDSLEVQSIVQEDQSPGWGIIVVLNTPRRNGSDLEVISCQEKAQAEELRSQIEQGMAALGKELQRL